MRLVYKNRDEDAHGDIVGTHEGTGGPEMVGRGRRNVHRACTRYFVFLPDLKMLNEYGDIVGWVDITEGGLIFHCPFFDCKGSPEPFKQMCVLKESGVWCNGLKYKRVFMDAVRGSKPWRVFLWLQHSVLDLQHFKLSWIWLGRCLKRHQPYSLPGCN